MKHKIATSSGDFQLDLSKNKRRVIYADAHWVDRLIDKPESCRLISNGRSSTQMFPGSVPSGVKLSVAYFHKTQVPECTPSECNCKKPDCGRQVEGSASLAATIEVAKLDSDLMSIKNSTTLERMLQKRTFCSAHPTAVCLTLEWVSTRAEHEWNPRRNLFSFRKLAGLEDGKCFSARQLSL